MDELKPSRKLFSSYYVAVIISFFVFQLFGESWAEFSRGVLITFLSNLFNQDFSVGASLWWIFFFSMLAITLIIRRFIVEPLGFFIDSEDGAVWWDLLLMFLLVFGFYIFLLNLTFKYAMPSQFNLEVIRFLGGYRNTYLPGDPNPLAGSNPYITWFWYLAPLAYMYIRVRLTFKAP